MIDFIIKKFLEKKIDVKIFMVEPDLSLDRFVTFERISNSKKDYLYTTTFAFQSWANTLYDAMILNEKVKEALETLDQEKEVMYSKLQNDYNFTDTETKKYRYQAIFEIKY